MHRFSESFYVIHLKVDDCNTLRLRPFASTETWFSAGEDSSTCTSCACEVDSRYDDILWRCKWVHYFGIPRYEQKLWYIPSVYRGNISGECSL